MGRTPDRRPGRLVEEEVLMEDQGAGNDPTDAGAFRYVDGAFRFKDATGIFDPRSGGGGITESQHENLDTLAHEVAESGSLHVTRDAQNRIQAATYRVSSSPSSTKIREATVTRDGQGRISQVVETQFDGSGNAITGQTLTKTIVRDGTTGKISRVDVVQS
jgi:hypothetical protein